MSEEKKQFKLFNIMGSELVLGSLVALLSLLTAVAAYQGGLSDSAEADANVEGQKILSNSNTEFLRSNQDIIQDYTMYDGWYINDGVNAENADYYKLNFSEALVTSMERPDGPFDDAYYTEVYTDADASYEEAMTKYDDAQKAGDKADKYQMDLMIFGVGLALAAWASLGREESTLRPIFGILSTLLGIYGLIVFFQLLAA